MVFLDCTILILKVNQVRTSQDLNSLFVCGGDIRRRKSCGNDEQTNLIAILKLESHLTLVRCFFEPLRISSSDFLLFMERKLGDVGEDTSGLTMAVCPFAVLCKEHFAIY
jgi:hypothetical protein